MRVKKARQEILEKKENICYFFRSVLFISQTEEPGANFSHGEKKGKKAR
jgi:hypothetical protein